MNDTVGVTLLVLDLAGVFDCVVNGEEVEAPLGLAAIELDSEGAITADALTDAVMLADGSSPGDAVDVGVRVRVGVRVGDTATWRALPTLASIAS